jgi:DNA repair protein RecO (recombination protein O)
MGREGRVIQRSDGAYVLGTRELGEADLIVTLLAEHAGRIRGVAASARRSRRRFGGALEPLSRVRASWVEREGRELHRIEALDLERSYAAMQALPERQAACAVICEIAGLIAHENEPEERSFRLTGAVAGALEDGLDPWVAVRYFEYWIARLHGLLPEAGACGRCGKELHAGEASFAAPPDGVLCKACAAGVDGARRLSPSELAMLAGFATKAPSEAGEHAAAARSGAAAERLLRGTIEAFLERPLRTYRHLKALLP